MCIGHSTDLTSRPFWILLLGREPEHGHSQARVIADQSSIYFLLSRVSSEVLISSFKFSTVTAVKVATATFCQQRPSLSDRPAAVTEERQKEAWSRLAQIILQDHESPQLPLAIAAASATADLPRGNSSSLSGQPGSARRVGTTKPSSRPGFWNNDQSYSA